MEKSQFCMCETLSKIPDTIAGVGGRELERVREEVHAPTASATYCSPLQVERAALESLMPRILPW